jgi:tetratricopeptide (TPR) repeat protein
MKSHLLVGMLVILPNTAFAQAGWQELLAEGKRLYLEQRYAEAEGKFRQAMTTPEYGAMAEVRDSVRCSLGMVATNQRRYVEAESLLKSCPTSTPHERFGAWMDLATLYSCAGRYAEADRLYRQASDFAQQDSSIGVEQRAILLDNMASHAIRKQNFQEAESLSRQARDLYAKTGAKWDLANATGKLGGALLKQGRLVEARAEFESAIRETEAAGGPSHSMLAGLLCALADVYNREGRFASAEPLLKRAVAIVGADYPYSAELFWTYAWTLRHLHRNGEAKAMEKRAKALAAVRKPPEVVGLSELAPRSGH